MSEIGAVADAAGRAVVSMFLVLGVGVTFAYCGKIDQQGLASMAETINFIFVPAILFNSMGQSLSIDAMRQAWTLVVVGLLTAPVSALASYPM